MLQERLKEQRRALGVTQAELAGLLGVSARAVYMWEAGERKPDIGMLIRLVKVFSVSADYLLGPSMENLRKILASHSGEKALGYRELFLNIRRRAGGNARAPSDRRSPCAAPH